MMTFWKASNLLNSIHNIVSFRLEVETKTNSFTQEECAQPAAAALFVSGVFTFKAKIAIKNILPSVETFLPNNVGTLSPKKDWNEKKKLGGEKNSKAVDFFQKLMRFKWSFENASSISLPHGAEIWREKANIFSISSVI